MGKNDLQWTLWVLNNYSATVIMSDEALQKATLKALENEIFSTTDLELQTTWSANAAASIS